MQMDNGHQLVEPAARLGVLIQALINADPQEPWNVSGMDPEPATDRGLHGNSYIPELGEDIIHFHHTPVGIAAVKFGLLRPAWNPNVNRRLGQLLKRGKTDPRFAEPDSFQQTTVEPGGVVAFRLNDPSSHLPYLHEFKTIQSPRELQITRLSRTPIAAAQYATEFIIAIPRGFTGLFGFEPTQAQDLRPHGPGRQQRRSEH
jgi:hypothetical protein